MAIVYAVKSGNWSDPTVWNTGSLPTSADDVRSNTYTVTIDGNYSVLTLSNQSDTGVTSGGTFNLLNNVTFTSTNGIFNSTALGKVGPSNVGAITYNQTSGTANIVTSSIYGGPIIADVTGTSNKVGISALGSGTLNITGNILAGGFGGNGQGCRGIAASGSVNVNITGNCTGGFANGGENSAVVWASTGTLNITGNLSGNASYALGINHNSSGITNLTGNINSNGLRNNSTGAVTVSGITYGNGVVNASTGNVFLIGSLIPSEGLPSVSGGTVSQNTFLVGPFITTNNGTQAVAVPRWLWKQTGQIPTYMEVRTETTLAMRPLYTADYVGGNPAVGNVRFGTVYGPNSELTGTCRIPPASSVRAGVAVDNTVGTAALSPSDLWNTLTSAMTTSGSIGERLKNAATVESVASTWAAG